jgi:hypothetical protein
MWVLGWDYVGKGHRDHAAVLLILATIDIPTIGPGRWCFLVYILHYANLLLDLKRRLANFFINPLNPVSLRPSYDLWLKIKLFQRDTATHMDLAQKKSRSHECKRA